MTWGYSPFKAKLKVSEFEKADVSCKAQKLIDEYLKPTHVKPPPRNPQFNYITDIFTKWHGSYFYFCAKYACPFSNAISPTFEHGFARMRYLGSGRFSLAYLRHNDQWNEIYPSLSEEECLESIRDEPHFIP